MNNYNIKMKLLILYCIIGAVSVHCGETETDITIQIGDILRKLTSGILNSKNGNNNGFYEVGDDGSIHFILKDESQEDSSTSTSGPITATDPTTITPQPSLTDDESVLKDISFDESDDTPWEFVPSSFDPLTNSGEFPLVDTNEIEDEPRSDKDQKYEYIIERKKRDVNVDVGGGHGGSGGVDVAVNKPGNKVNVNVGGIEAFLSQFGVHFKKPAGGGGSSSGGYGNYGGSGVNVNVDKHGHNSNVDVNVGGHGKPVAVNVNKPGYGGSDTAVNVDWASFIPLVNVGVNKGHGGDDVKVNVGQNGHPGGSLVDVKVNKGAKRHNEISYGEHETFVRGGGIPHKNVNVGVSGFVDVNVDADHNAGEPFPHKPPKKHHKKPHHEHEDKDVQVNVGGQNGGSWWPFVNVNVDGAKTKSGGKKCLNINVPFVNVLLNRGCKELDTSDHPGDGPNSVAFASASASASSS